jgi:hypothetical protein|tara:strand:+ start:37 stop:156 length:120 start_codon:yes stop_codon:yes gene_type:complete
MGTVLKEVVPTVVVAMLPFGAEDKWDHAGKEEGCLRQLI